MEIGSPGGCSRDILPGVRHGTCCRTGSLYSFRGEIIVPQIFAAVRHQPNIGVNSNMLTGTFELAR